MTSPAFTAFDHEMMARALQLAELGRFTTKPNPMVGCVLVRDDQVVGEGWHQRAGEAHAEINALKDAGDAARGATAYVTLEPCSMCAGLIVHSRVARVVFAASEPRAGVAISQGQFFDQAFLNHRVLVEGGVLADVAPTMLHLLGMEKPQEMTGHSILVNE